MNYAVRPGLYAVVSPDKACAVPASANYKLSFDTLRGELKGQDVWILVLDTKGINVWCAAGKGTFGTAELVKQIKNTGLDKIVNHRKIVVPQLGAPGVAAHRVKQQTGFRVAFGPVRAKHVPAFLNKQKLPADFRRVKLTFIDRLVLTALEFMTGLFYIMSLLTFFFLSSGFHQGRFEFDNWWQYGIPGVLALSATHPAGAVLTPLFLPFAPGRAFSVKGMIVHTLVFVVLYLFLSMDIFNMIDWAALWCTGSAVSAFFAMNFTGASTYTSLSGVEKEMRCAVPAELALMVVGVSLWVAGGFL